MKKALMSLALCCLMVVGTSSVSNAIQTDQPALSSHESTSPDSQNSDMDMGKDVQMMQDHIDKMRGQMEKIRVTTDPQERHKLMDEHLATMKDGMKMMKSIPGCKMMSEGKGMMGMDMKSNGEKMSKEKMDGSKPMAEGKGMMGMMSGGKGMMGMDKMMKCHKVMEKKNEMMQMMVDGLIEFAQMKK